MLGFEGHQRIPVHCTFKAVAQMAEGCRRQATDYRVEDEGVPTSTTKEQVL